MLPTRDAGGPQGPLEDRLRNLIITNSDSTGRDASSQLPPPGPGAMDYQTQPSLDQIAEQGPQGIQPTANRESQTGTKTSRKRPNQAQRRQMSAQLSIPIDPRPQPPPQAARHYTSPTSTVYGHNSQFQGSQQMAQRPQSAGFRPTYYSQPFQHTDNISRGYPAQPRHQQSQSYHGPVSQARAPDWRQPPGPPPGRGADYASRGHNPSFSDHGASSPAFHRYPNSAPHHQPRHHHVRSEDLRDQASLLEELCRTIIADAEIDVALIQEKETFRLKIERICQNAIAQFERETNRLANFPLDSVQLRCFGSLSSGFATKASDMDLGILSPLSNPQPDEPGSPIPRILEKAFLDAGLGARLLTRTRVPIIKLCESPPEKLRQDLLRERTKWEQGITDDHDSADVDDHEHEEPERPSTQDGPEVHDVAAPKDLQPTGNVESAMANNTSDAARQRSSKPVTNAHTRPGEKTLRLKQADRQHLVNYYSLAKRLLRKLDSRDITHSTAKHFRHEDFIILNEVSRAFVRGLSDGRLRDRLMSYHSFYPCDAMGTPVFRSLAGVYTQAEGERLVIAWEERKVHEKSEANEIQALRKINAWRELQDRDDFGLDLLGYNKELQLAADQLGRIPSIQLMTLEQGQYESPTQYHRRAIKLLLDLGGYDSTTSTTDNLPIHATTIEHYIKGIWSDEIRKQVRAFALENGSVTLRAVARRHKGLHLAAEFEKAIEKGLYDGACVEDIKAYVALLRMPLTYTPSTDNHFDYLVHTSASSSALLKKILKVADPAKLAPNQPRDPYRDRLEFPKSGVGVQCDINFSAHLALQNTLLLRCYSHTDPRVRPMVLFVKHWAKVRDINTPYRGTLSSYGYVLMVLHYLVNIAQPFVCPNLQVLAPPPDPSLTKEQLQETMFCKGRNIQFWRDENAIKNLAREGTLTQNRDPIGVLLRGFFEYYAQNNFLSTAPGRGFDWGRDVLSLRTQGGLVSKQDKGWTGAKTVLEKIPSAAPPDQTAPPKTPVTAETPPPITPVSIGPGNENDAKLSATPREGEVKEVRHRYLFAIEDPFELDHNVARTVTHNGIVSIRDEFRRAWRIIRSTGKGGVPQENLLQDVKDKGEEKNLYWELLAELHGRESFEA
ncbi:uncharacterized protein E0L32_004841 [Thyridium curvatum]|uniref:polynucleotide adenylyltransferase n=1 Tax=Thyridium curvatum TaxID=1093900 RepID=A0A507BDK8_9PEZI|nr:uncharacterized protein E0L32_004841 [Thyridium curvatum]TPX15011.1 hypothetical protein E0L32_004841 [Thyridium curvatum]